MSKRKESPLSSLTFATATGPFSIPSSETTEEGGGWERDYDADDADYGAATGTNLQHHPYDELWRILNKPENAIDSSAVQIKLSELGLKQSDLLEYLEEKEISDLSGLLKKIPAKEFVSKFEAVVFDIANATSITAAATSTNASAQPPRKKAATATAVGSNITKSRLTFIEGTSNKFWQIELLGSDTITTYGRIGCPGTSSKAVHESSEEAGAFAENMVKEKLNKGYVYKNSAEESSSFTTSASSASSYSSSASGGGGGGGVIHPKPGDKFFFESSSKANCMYEVTYHGDHCSCTCPNWRFQSGSPKTRKLCLHIKKLIAEGRLSADDVNREMDGDDEEVSKVGEGKKIPPLKLAEKYEDNVDPIGWWMSEKFDGVRTFWDGSLFYSRLGNVFNAPDYFKANLPINGLTLDGELWTGRKKFSEAVGIAKTQHDAGWRQMKFLVFDAPSLDMVFEERQRFLQDYFLKHPNSFVEIVKQKRCVSKADLQLLLESVEAKGGEGIMLVKPNTKYVKKRSKDLLKFKTFHDCEAVIVGYNPGKGAAKGSVGSFTVRLASGKQCGVGSGLTAEMRRNPPKLGTEITIRYQELSADGIPRFPTFVRIAQTL